MGAGTRSWRLGQEEITQASSKSLAPPIHAPARDSDGAICIDDAQCFLHESFQQRHQDNINVLHASLMANQLVKKMQRFITTRPTIQIGYTNPAV